MAKPGRPQRNRTARSFRQFRRFRHVINSDEVFGTHNLILRGAETESHIQEALRLSPRDSGVFRWLHWVGIAKLLQGADAEAVAWLRRSLEANRNNPLAHFHLGAALMLLGKPDEARGAVRSGFALDPMFTIRRMRRISDDPAFRAQAGRIRDAMRLAGVPEG